MTRRTACPGLSPGVPEEGDGEDVTGRGLRGHSVELGEEAGRSPSADSGLCGPCLVLGMRPWVGCGRRASGG